MNDDGRIHLKTSFAPERVPGRAFQLFQEWMDRGKLGFMELPGDIALLERTLKLKNRLSPMASTMIVCGIGGSSLGLRALLCALDGQGREASGRVEVADSPDSMHLKAIADSYDPDDSILTVITKSGGTAETVSMFLSLYNWIRSASEGPARIVAVTDPERGDLRRLARDMDLPSLPVPPAVGGRYSVLSPVGLFPAAFAGIDIEALLKGAGQAAEEFLGDPESSAAGEMASAFLTNFNRRPVHAFFPYDDRLRSTADWFAQLWAESLGKCRDLDGGEKITGQTPLACRGPADQHSLVQLFMEGPGDKTVTILTTPPSAEASPLPGGFDDYSSFSYLKGITADRLRIEEALATEKALAEAGTPVTRIQLPALNETVMGSLLMNLEIATVLCGLALNINPLDQPGVERGKLLTYKALNRPGYSS